jgi:hypothetical protein
VSEHPWPPESFHRFVQTIESSSRTAYIHTDAGPAYLKAINNPEGPHILACDWFGTELARRFGLPTFDVAILHLTDLDEIPIGDGVMAAPGPTFVSREEKGTTLGGTEALQEIVNPEDIPRLIVFDTWLRNCDRFGPEYGKEGQPRINPDNVFLSSDAQPLGKFILKAMDHGHIFTCGRPLTTRLGQIGNVKDRRLYGLFPEFREFVTVEAIDGVAAEFSTVTPALWADLLRSIPSEWEITEPVRKAIDTFLIDRAQFLRDNLHDIAHRALSPGQMNFGNGNGDNHER